MWRYRIEQWNSHGTFILTSYLSLISIYYQEMTIIGVIFYYLEGLIYPEPTAREGLGKVWPS